MDIDFVVLWVDGNDPFWKSDFEKHTLLCEGDKSEKRYRDWDNLRYLFRAFEKFTPWVRNIHLVTYGHLPKWLNIDHPKINIVNHSDFLKASNLPVFNANAIEINLHRIRGLSETFVFFNDDTFLLKKISPDRFFKNNLPRDMLAFTTILYTNIAHIRLNNLLIIDKYFKKKQVLIKLFFKWFDLKYGINLLKSLFLLPWPQITGIVDPHQAQPFLKSTFRELWKKEYETLNKTSKSKVRSDTDVNQYLFRYWQLLTGKFLPVSFQDSYSLRIKGISDAEKIAEIIFKKKYTLCCIQDLIDNADECLFKKITATINKAFESILPNKSNFEL